VAEYRVLVTGSREWADRDLLERVLGAMLQRHRPLVIVHGKCGAGADMMAARWVAMVRRENFSVREEPHPARWDLLGKAAGHARNQEMADLGADVCLAFYWKGAENAGTSDCVARATAAGIPVEGIYGE
jgi:hypothetical protein